MLLLYKVFINLHDFLHGLQEDNNENTRTFIFQQYLLYFDTFEHPSINQIWID